MLERLDLKDIGPASKLHFDFGPRISIVTGDNGVEAPVAAGGGVRRARGTRKEKANA
jgi:hypothetical protein